MSNKPTEQLLFPILVGVFSGISLLMNLQAFYWTSVCVSFIGLTGTLLFFRNSNKAGLFFYVWIVLQLFTYATPNFTYFTNQLPFMNLSFAFHGEKSTFAINFLPLFYFIGYRIIKMYDLIGKQVSIKPIKADSKLTAIEGEIVEIIKTGKEGIWFKIRVSGNPDFNSVMIKAKDDERFSAKKSVLAYVKEGEGNRSFIDWGKVRLS